MKKVYVVSFAIALLAVSCMFSVPSVNAAAGSENSWKTLAPMPIARCQMSVGVANGKIYAIGGYNGSTININEMYNPTTNVWVTKKSMPTLGAGFAIAVFQNKLYCIGGRMDIGVNEVYDPVTDVWETKQPIPTPRTVLSAAVVNDKIYVLGGFVPSSIGLPQPERSNLNEMYDPITDSWTTMAPLPTAVAYCISTVVDDKIYVLGNTGNNNELQIYYPQTNKWSYGPSMPYSMAYEAGAATTGVYAAKRIYLIGGSKGLTQIFDPETKTWSTGAEMPTSRRQLGVAVVDDLLYAIGGEDNGRDGFFSGANERYTPLGYSPVPPAVHVVSPEQNKTYTSGNVSLTFTVDKPVAELSYSLNGEANVTVTGNTTLTGLANGAHNVTIYAAGSVGNVGASQPILFTVAPEQHDPEPFPTALVAAASGASAVAVGACLLVYFKKHRRQDRKA